MTVARAYKDNLIVFSVFLGLISVFCNLFRMCVRCREVFIYRIRDVRFGENLPSRVRINQDLSGASKFLSIHGAVFKCGY